MIGCFETNFFRFFAALGLALESRLRLAETPVYLHFCHRDSRPRSLFSLIGLEIDFDGIILLRGVKHAQHIVCENLRRS